MSSHFLHTNATPNMHQGDRISLIFSLSPLSGESVKCVRDYDGVCGWIARLYLWDVAYDLFIPLYFAPFQPIHRVIACLIFADSDKLYALKMTIDYA